MQFNIVHQNSALTIFLNATFNLDLFLSLLFFGGFHHFLWVFLYIIFDSVTTGFTHYTLFAYSFRPNISLFSIILHFLVRIISFLFISMNNRNRFLIHQTKSIYLYLYLYSHKWIYTKLTPNNTSFSLICTNTIHVGIQIVHSAAYNTKLKKNHS